VEDVLKQLNSKFGAGAAKRMSDSYVDPNM